MLLNFTLALGAAYVARSGIGLFQLLGSAPSRRSWSRCSHSMAPRIWCTDSCTRCRLLWRVHLVHHIDASVDATTAFRQHPIEGILRFTFIAATAWTLGAPPAAVAVYRLLGALNSVLEHANIRVPRVLDRALVWLWVTPDMHKVHHSRDRVETDSNYANLFSFFDRVFRTFTPSSRGPFVRYGIRGYDAAEHQSIGAVLRLPFQRSVDRAGADHDRHSEA